MAGNGILKLLAETPWAIRPSVLQAIVQLALKDETEGQVVAARRSGGTQMAGSVAVIPLYGMLTPKPGLFSALLGGTAVSDFQRALADAVSNPDVGSVLIDTDSPGGLVSGIPEAAAAIRAARGRKPIVAIANGEAASAAYWLASQAGEMVATPSGQVGSVGVYAAHEDISAALEQAGVNVTLVAAGEYKTEGNPYEPLSTEARDHMQSMVDEYYGAFVGDIAKGRTVSAKAVEDGYGRGRMLTANRALAAGMVDRVDTFDATIRRMATGQVGRGRLSAESPATAWTEFTATTSTTNYSAEVLGDDVSSAVKAALTGPLVGPIPSHSTGTDDGTWDGAGNEARITGSPEEVEADMHRYSAWEDTAADRPRPKSAFKFGHHLVSGDGSVGDASMQGCRAGIGALNGARSRPNIPDGDRSGVHSHLASHLRDGGLDVPPLSEAPQQEPKAMSREDRVRLFKLRAIQSAGRGI